MQQFKCGDVVRLKKGSILRTVRYHEDNIVCMDWIDKKLHPQRISVNASRVIFVR
jgi:hypothetical protein